MDSANSSPCLIRLERFEGPLDLLLHLIKKNELDIYDIPIALITRQYGEYLGLMKVLNIDALGEYMVMAAELGLIKSQMLLPDPPPDEDGEPDGDPRQELVRMLLEYQRFKDASEELSGMDMLERDVFSRLPAEIFPLEVKQMNIEQGDLWMLIGALRDIFKRRNQPMTQTIQLELEIITVEEVSVHIITQLKRRGKMMFSELFSATSTAYIVVVTFLAVLDLLNSMTVIVTQDGAFSPIEVAYSGE